jgi:hypothetical protein
VYWKQLLTSAIFIACGLGWFPLPHHATCFVSLEVVCPSLGFIPDHISVYVCEGGRYEQSIEIFTGWQRAEEPICSGLQNLSSSLPLFVEEEAVEVSWLRGSVLGPLVLTVSKHIPGYSSQGHLLVLLGHVHSSPPYWGAGEDCGIHVIQTVWVLGLDLSSSKCMQTGGRPWRLNTKPVTGWHFVSTLAARWWGSLLARESKASNHHNTVHYLPNLL